MMGMLPSWGIEYCGVEELALATGILTVLLFKFIQILQNRITVKLKKKGRL
jgi:Mg2+/Co2+ transporter CorB